VEVVDVLIRGIVVWVAICVITVAFFAGARKGRRVEEAAARKELLRQPMVKTPPRPNWDKYFLLIAQAVSSRGECVRSKVGAVLVRDNRIISTGYNGVAAGDPSCLDGICPRSYNDVPRGVPYDGEGLCIATHAEDNAIHDAMRRGLPAFGATIYLTKEPCEKCQGLLDSLEIRAVWDG
jgi:dCMP deaminase